MSLARRTIPSFLAVAAISARLNAQPAEFAFDYRTELRFPRPATTLVRGDFTGDRTPDILVAGPGHLTLFEQGRTSFDWKTSSAVTSSATPLYALTGRLNGDIRDDLVLLRGPRPVSAEVYLTGAGKLPALSYVTELPGEFQQAGLADLDGDRNADLLLYGKKTLGITVYKGNGRGGFSPGPVLFPEIPVSQAAVALIDGDDIADIVLVDWIGNRIEVFPGFGGMNYGDPVILPFDEEPIALAVSELNGDRYRDIVAGFGETPGYAVLTGDGKGNFGVHERTALEAAPWKIRVGDIDGDSRNELLLSLPAKRSIVVKSQDGAGRFSLQQSFASGGTAADIVFFQDSRRKFLNAAILSTEEGIVRILHSRSPELPVSEGWTLATAVEPADLEVADLNDDGWADVALTYASEPVIDLYMNNGRGGLSGRASLRLPAPMADLIPIGSPPGRKDFLAVVNDRKSFAYLSIGSPDLTVRPLLLRTEAPVEPVDGGIREGDTGFRIYALREESGTRNAAIYAYDIVDRVRYEETDMSLALPGRFVAAARYDFDGDSRRDLALITAPDTGNAHLLTVYRQTGEGFEREHTTALNLPGGQFPDIVLWIADLDGDRFPDLVLNVRKPDNILAVATASGDSAYGIPATVLTDVRIPSRKSLAVTDFDADGRADLVFVNEKTRTVQFLPGDGRGGFVGPVNLTNARGVTGFGIADINRDRENELILSIADEGVLAVTSFHHPLFGRKKARP